MREFIWYDEPILRNNRFRNKMLIENITEICIAFYFLPPFGTEKILRIFVALCFWTRKFVAWTFPPVLDDSKVIFQNQGVKGILTNIPDGGGNFSSLVFFTLNEITGIMCGNSLLYVTR
jgi:hypothetical protein